MPLHLSALADLEWLLRDDARPLEPEREQAVGARVVAECGLDAAAARRHVDDDAVFRRALALGWLQAVREQRDDLPGAWIGRGVRLAGWVLTIGGLLLGAGAAKALLVYDGSVPVNVLSFIGFFFVLQIVLLVMLIAFLLRTRARGTPAMLHRRIAWLARRFVGRGHDLDAVLRTLHARHGLYTDVERWTLFELAQRFGVAFNVGAFVAALHAIVFSDLVFSWSTTLALDAGMVHGLAEALALPWSWYPAAVVDLEVVQASQWVRMPAPGAFVGELEPEQAVLLAAEWWQFLIAGLLTYGLVPRAIAWGAGQALAARALRRAAFDHAGFRELFERMLPSGSGWQGPAPDDVVGPKPVAGRQPETPRAPELPGARTVAVAWGSIARHQQDIAALIERRFAVPARLVVEAGSAALTSDDDAIDRISDQRAARIVFFMAAGYQPTADVLDFLGRLRGEVGRTLPIVVGLVDFAADGACFDADDDERAAWKRSLAALDDAYVWVEAMGATV